MLLLFVILRNLVILYSIYFSIQWAIVSLLLWVPRVGGKMEHVLGLVFPECDLSTQPGRGLLIVWL